MSFLCKNLFLLREIYFHVFCSFSFSFWYKNVNNDCSNKANGSKGKVGSGQVDQGFNVGFELGDQKGKSPIGRKGN